MAGKAVTPTPALLWKDLDPPVLTAARAGSGASALHPCRGFTPCASADIKHGVLSWLSVVLQESGF